MSPRVVEFDWDDANIEHIALHDVVPSEVKEAFLDNDAIDKPFGVRNGEMRYSMLGRTAAGRLLRVVYVIRKGALRPVTAYTATRRDQRSFESGRRKDGTRYSRFRF
jgi:uncharacterized DUF497 family protein